MQHSDFYFFVNIAFSYVTFGLAIYAIAGFIALLWTHRKTDTSRPLMRDVYLAHASVIGLIFLDACRLMWDNLGTHHFPLQVSQIVLPALYLLMGNALVSRARVRYRQPGSSEMNDDSNEQKEASA